ncbi:hypothetical protein D1BOALGB6SA_6886 [Olavius sp. associated proteobacterium Delta 1]|nr:hypothetical protein D1BOALGB6SA_6886 [Olavius sp. associated proteobacterium Delta 1]
MRKCEKRMDWWIQELGNCEILEIKAFCLFYGDQFFITPIE